MRGVWALAALAPLVGVPGNAFVAVAPTFTVDATAASFSVGISPTPTVSRRGQNIFIEWPAITISSGRAVSYRVERHRVGQTAEVVCTLTDPTPVADTILSCRDFKPGTGAEYRIQAFVTGPDGGQTWSLPASDAVGM